MTTTANLSDAGCWVSEMTVGTVLDILANGNRQELMVLHQGFKSMNENDYDGVLGHSKQVVIELIAKRLLETHHPV